MSNLSKKKRDQAIETEKPKKVGRRVEEYERDEAEEMEGAPVGRPKTEGKKKGLQHIRVKHKIVLKNMVEKGGKVSVSKALRDEGYSEAYIKSGKFKNTKSWGALVERDLPDHLLTETHKNLLIAKKVDYMLFTPEITEEEIYDLIESVGCTVKKIVNGIAGIHVWFWAPDNKSRKDATELAYKVKGKLAPERIQLEATGLQAMSDAELAEVIRKQKNKFLKKD